jgi:hypothetical protein
MNFKVENEISQIKKSLKNMEETKWKSNSQFVENPEENKDQEYVGKDSKSLLILQKKLLTMKK